MKKVDMKHFYEVHWMHGKFADWKSITYNDHEELYCMECEP